MRIQRLTLWRTVVGAGILLAVVFGLAQAPAANAALAGCRADPVFLLSDGTVLDVQVAIGTDVSNVDLIQYEVHGPAGVYLVTALSTPTLGFKGLERVRYFADAAPNQYITDTLVETSVPKVSATSYTLFVGNQLSLLRLRLSPQYHVVQGFAGQHLIATLYK